tara:strand:+ start:8971 stop:11286 length:2316 start_codon:yes stop_codon:yes gene_type:complete
MAHAGNQILKAFGRGPSTLRHRFTWARLTTLFGVAAVLVTAFVAYVTYAFESANFNARQAKESELRSIAVQKEIDLHIEHLRTLAQTVHLVSDLGDVERDRFNAMTPVNTFFDFIGWVHQAGASNMTGDAGIASGGSNSATGQREPVPMRATMPMREQVSRPPITHVFLAKPGATSMGLDPVSRLWDQYVLTGNTSHEFATVAVSDNPQIAHAKAFVAVAMLPQDGDAAENARAKQKPDGFITAVIDVGRLFETLIGSRPPQGHDVAYFGSAKELDLGTPFHQHLSRRTAEQGRFPWSLFPDTGYRWSNVVNVADQTWTVVSTPLKSMVFNEVYLPAAMVMLIGLVMVVLSTACLRLNEMRRLQAETFSDRLRRSQRLEAVGQLSGGIAHDFNNVLGVVMGNLEFLQRMVADQPKAMQRVDKALKAATRGSDVVARLQAFSSLEPRPGEPTDANMVIGDLKDVFQKSLTSEIALDFQPGAGLWLTDVDAADLSASLVNLVFNARTAMPSGGRLGIMTENQTVLHRSGSGEWLTPGDYVVVTVSDVGTGMPPAVRDRAIEPFFSAWPGGGGNGLGLSMVYGFAKRSRGHLRIQSKSGQGTTVRLYLPRSASVAAKPARPDMAADTLRGAGVVLVVDDEPDLRDIAETMLSHLGYTTISAKNGREAQTILENDLAAEIDLVLSDVIMPGGIDGFELAEWIRESRPGVKVLLTSGFTGKLAGRNADPALIRTIVKKPYSKKSLARAIKAALDLDMPDLATTQSHPRQTTANDAV